MTHNNLDHYVRQKGFPAKVSDVLKGFVVSYSEVARQNGYNDDQISDIIERILEAIAIQVERPYQFEPYHERIREPIDYYQLGIDFIKPVVDIKASTLSGLKNLKEIDEKVKAGENVVLFANHQVEADPQAVSIMLEEKYPQLGEEMIFVAGERVLTDPMAAPFSMGRNLLCIYSKKYIDNPPEKKTKKQQHNKRTMQLMSELLSVGGKCIYVAPSGGRDRAGKDGVVEVAPFDAQSIEMFQLMARRSKKRVHFYPLSMATYSILPPPETIQIELGESRHTKGGPIHLHFGDVIDMDHIPNINYTDRQALKKERAEYIHKLVDKMYKNFKVTY